MTYKTELMAGKPKAIRAINLTDALFATRAVQYPHIDGIGPLWEASLVSPISSEKLEASGRSKHEATMIVLNLLVREAYYNNWNIHGVLEPK